MAETPQTECPNCGSLNVKPPDEGFWAECEDCLHVQYDAETLALQAEVKREQKQAKEIFGRIPTYAEWSDFLRQPQKRDRTLEID